MSYTDHRTNVVQNGNYILNGERIATCQGPVQTLINKYQEFCQELYQEYFL